MQTKMSVDVGVVDVVADQKKCRSGSHDRRGRGPFYPFFDPCNSVQTEAKKSIQSVDLLICLLSQQEQLLLYKDPTTKHLLSAIMADSEVAKPHS